MHESLCRPQVFGKIEIEPEPITEFTPALIIPQNIMIEEQPTPRGFFHGDFEDLHGEKCSIQKSSLATQPAIWLGVNESRMHLSQEHVKQLLPYLQHFAETGELKIDE